MDYNIALLPPSETKQKLLDLSSAIHKDFGSQFILNEKDSLPHITLYLAGFPSAATDQIHSKLSAICSTYSLAEVQINGSTITKSGLVMLNCTVSKQLKFLHEEILKEISSFRKGIIADNWIDGLENLNEQQSLLLDKFGYPYAMELWYPHFTVAKVNPLDIDRVKSFVDGFDEEFTARKVGLGIAGTSGVFTCLLRACQLKSQ